jgi:hypothetical protein
MSKAASYKRKTRSSQSIHKGSDLTEILDFRMKIKDSMAISDVVESGAIPFFEFRQVGGKKYGNPLEESSIGTLNSGGSVGTSRTNKTDHSGIESLSIKGSTILEEYGKYEPTGYKAFVAEKLKDMEDEENIKKLYLRTLDLIKSARRSVDPSSEYFEAAALYEEMAAIPKAIMYYERAVANQCPPEEIVDAKIMPWSKELDRKVLHLNAEQKVIFFSNREKERKEHIYIETERQRLRILVTHCQLVRLHLLLDETKLAHKNISLSFKKCRTAIEHLEVLRYMNSILKETSLHLTPEVSRAMQIYKGSAGPLAECHIRILHELLEQDGRDIDTLTWLAKRYAEKCEFEISKQYNKRIRDIKEPPYNSVETLDRYQIRGTAEAMAESEWMNAIWKRDAGGFSFHTEKDAKMHLVREDFTTFPGLHKAAQTTFYEAPTQGWGPACAFQEEGMRDVIEKTKAKIEKAKQRQNTLPVVNGKVIHPDSMQAKRMQLEKDAEERRMKLSKSVNMAEIDASSKPTSPSNDRF